MPNDDLQFCQKLRERLRRQYFNIENVLLPEEMLAPSPEYEALMERAASLADRYGCDSFVFRQYLTEVADDLRDFPRQLRSTKKQLSVLSQLIAKMQEPPDKSAIPKDAELLTVAQTATLINMGESTVRERDRKGLIPRPVKVKGTILWSKRELRNWIDADCPARGEWEMRKEDTNAKV